MWNETFSNVTSNAGGFLSGAGGAGAVDSPQQKNKGPRRMQNVLSVCARQLNTCQDEEFTLFGMAAPLVKIVGVLKDHEVLTVKATYEIEDHTGRIQAIWWLDNDSNTNPALPLVKEGSYVRIHGSLRTQEGKKIIMVIKMFPVDDINEITSHFLEVIHIRLQAEAMISGNATSTIRQNNPGRELANSMSFMDTDDDMKREGFTPIQAKVFKILQPVTHVNGLARSSILQHFPPNLHGQVNNALEFLINEGHAYSTIDNDHLKATDTC